MAGTLACIDFSDASDAVASEAARLAAESGEPLHLLHVAAAEPELAGYDRDPISSDTRNERAGELRDEHRWLREAAARLQQRGVTVIPVLTMGPAVEGILAEADRLDVDLIVLGSHGHGALHHLLHGSVAQGVLDHTTRPAHVVPVAQR